MFLLLPLALVRPSQPASLITSADGELQAALPPSWDQADLHAVGAQIQAVNSIHHAYLVVTSTRRADVAGTLENYAVSDLQRISQHLLDVQFSEPRRFQTATASCIQYEVHATLSKSRIRVAYLFTFMETPKHYIKVSAWTTESRFQANMAQLSRVSASVIEIPLKSP